MYYFLFLFLCQKGSVHWVIICKVCFTLRRLTLHGSICGGDANIANLFSYFFIPLEVPVWKNCKSVFPLPQGFPYQFTLHVQCGSSLIYPNIILMFNILFSCQFRLVSDFCLSTCTKIYSLNVSISTLLSKTMELKSYCGCGIFPTVSQDIVNDL